MCTTSIIPRQDESGKTNGLRLACNRDELRTRPPAQPPRIADCGEHTAIMPIDPATGGTWIAVNDAGVVMTLLNRNFTDQRRQTRHAPHSRGVIIPALLNTDGIEQAYRRVMRQDPADYEPFRLIIGTPCGFLSVTSDGSELVREDVPLKKPIMFTSSGLGDHLVEPPRTELFLDSFHNDAAAWSDEQDAYHRHRWPDRLAHSVCMSRPDARTVSLTIVEIDSDAVRLIYHDDSPDVDAPTQSFMLPRGARSAT